jgi:ribose 5-phosphate isomerase B
MEIHCGSDHRGFELKQQVLAYLNGLGHTCVDHGCHSIERADYPRSAQAVGQAVVADPLSAGVVICGSGAGIAIAANKVRGVRCTVAWCEHAAEYGRRHNHANVLAFGSDLQTFTQVKRCLDAFLAAAPEAGRHSERVEMLRLMDEMQD